MTAEWTAMRAKSEHCAQGLQNLQKLRLKISDHSKRMYAGAGVDLWIQFAHSIPNLKSLRLDLCDPIWSKPLDADLFQENSFPHLESLSLFEFRIALDFKMLLSVSNKINTLEFHIWNDGSVVCKNLARAHLRSLRKLTCHKGNFRKSQWTHIKNELEARPTFSVHYAPPLDLMTAEKLGSALRLPNFDWTEIKVHQREDARRVDQLSHKFGIDSKKFTFA